MPLILICAAALVGLAIGDLQRLDPGPLLLTAATGTLGAAWRTPPRAWRLAAAMAGAACLGALRATAALPAENADETLVQPYLNSSVRLRATLLEPAPLRAEGALLRLIVAVQAVAPTGRDLPPALETDPPRHTNRPPPRLTVLATSPSTVSGPEPLARGETLTLEGYLAAPSADRGPVVLERARLLDHAPDSHPPPLTAQLSAVAETVRAHVRGALQRHLPPAQAALASGVLLGGSDGLDATFKEQLQRTGLSHLLAIDGYKMIVVTAALQRLSLPLLGPRLTAPPLVLLLLAYVVLTGAHASAIRAGLMIGLATLASLIGRLPDALTSLLLAVLAMALIQPPILLDLGLQLSLAATVSIILAYPRIRRLLRGARRGPHRLPPWIVEPCGLTLAVTLGTLPLLLTVFAQVSLISPLSHVLALPLLAPILVGTALLAVAAPLDWLASPLSWAVLLPTTALIDVTRLTAALPGAAVTTGRLPFGPALALTVALLAWGAWGLPDARDARQALTAALTRHARLARASTSLLLLGSGLALARVVRPDGQLHVVPLDVNQGQAVFIRGPTGTTTLVVSGRPEPRRLQEGVAEQLAVWEHKLDLLVITDARARDAAAPTLARYPPDHELTIARDERRDLGGGAVLDLYADATSASVSCGTAWLAVVGQPPQPGDPSDPARRGPEIRSARTTSAARPGSASST